MESVRNVSPEEDDLLVRGLQQVNCIDHHAQETWEHDALPLPDKGIHIGPTEVPNEPMLESAIGPSLSDECEPGNRELARAEGT
eukprot:11935420-Alexandrium_andersonii.AAC.1